MTRKKKGETSSQLNALEVGVPDLYIGKQYSLRQAIDRVQKQTGKKFKTRIIVEPESEIEVTRTK